MIPHGYWLFWLGVMVLGGFAVPEAIAITNKQGGDTRENIRRWLRTDTPGGGASWLAVWSVLLLLILCWLGGHILRIWS